MRHSIGLPTPIRRSLPYNKSHQGIRGFAWLELARMFLYSPPQRTIRDVRQGMQSKILASSSVRPTVMNRPSSAFPDRIPSPACCDRRCGRRFVLTASLWLFLLFTASAFAEIKYTGVNLAGAEFGQNVLPGTYGTHYIYPTAAEVNYFVGKGMNTFRLPFRWERLQRSQNAGLDATEVSRIDTFVNHATGLGANVILDPHNFARYFPDPANYQSSTTGLVGSSVPNSAFANFWSRVADRYKSNSKVMFNLMNEPNTMPTEQWVGSANAAIAAIRATGAKNLILVPGNAWSGAWQWSNNWYGTPNAVAMLNIVDPLNNYAYDAHQYLDSDGSGTSQTIVSATIGAQRLAGFTTWLRNNNRRGFLGEWAVARQIVGPGASQNGDEAMENLLAHVEANSDVWLGWNWWASGPWWGDYMFTLDPSNGQDRPQMPILEPHHVGIQQITCDFDRDNFCDIHDLNDLFSQGPLSVPRMVLPSINEQFDLDGNGMLDTMDVLEWLTEAGPRNGLGSGYRLGDANLDGVVDGSDFNLWNAHKFTSTSRWDDGDFNADGVVDGSDFNVWNSFKFQSSDGRSSEGLGQFIPEPCGGWLLVTGSAVALLRRPRSGRHAGDNIHTLQLPRRSPHCD